MGKVVINRCFGGFGLSEEGERRFRELNGMSANEQLEVWMIDRQNDILVQVVEELGPRSWGDYAQLAVVEVPTGVHFRITEYDGREGIELRDLTDWQVGR